MPGAALPRTPRDHRPCLLSREIGRGSLRYPKGAGRYREDPDVLRAQAAGRASQGGRHRDGAILKACYSPKGAIATPDGVSVSLVADQVPSSSEPMRTTSHRFWFLNSMTVVLLPLE